jgi:molecular chaperone GrpE
MKFKNKSGEDSPQENDDAENQSQTPGQEEQQGPVSREEHEAVLARLKELEAMREKLVHTAADFDNAKKRLAREKEDYLKFAQENLLRSLLPIVNNFERALAHRDQGQANFQSWVTGVEMIAKQMGELLKTQGLERIASVGQEFDPHVHEAVAYLKEAGKENEVIDEIEPGYLLHGRLLKPAKVRVRILPEDQGLPQ